MKLQAAYKLIKKETMAQMFFCEIYEVFKYTFFTEHLRESTPENVNWNLNASVVCIIYEELRTSSLISLLLVVKRIIY